MTELYAYRLLEDGTAEIVRYLGFEDHVSIPEHVAGIPVRAIGDGAFDSNETVCSVRIPDSVTDIGSNPFSACKKIISIQVSPKHPTLAAIGGVLFRKADRCLISYPGGLEETDYAVPEGIQTIGDYAFYGCSPLKQIVIPESVKSIGSHAFQRCAGLREITIPGGVESIGVRRLPTVRCS